MKLLKLNKLKLSQLSIRNFNVFFYHARTVRKKLVLFFAPIVLILGPIVIMALYNASNAEAAWYHSGWEYRKKIVIDESKVSGSSNLTDFPVLISFTDAHVKSLAQSDGDDMIFTSSDGTTKLSHEIEKYNSSTGQLTVWVKVSTLDYDDDTVIYMYYGNSTTSSQQSSTGVWDSNFKGVWHFPETSGAHQDSTTNNNDSTTVNVTTQGSATGKIDGADDYASGSEVVVNDHSSLDITSDFTLEAWVKADTLPTADNYSSIIYKGANGNYLLELYDNGDIEVGFHNGSSWVAAASTTNPISTGTFYHIVATFDNAANTLKGYVNAVEYSSNTSASGNPAANTSTVTFGENTYSETFDGVIDEVRISNTKRSTDWITTEYNNQNDPATFYSIGGTEQKNKPFLYWKFDEGQGQITTDSRNTKKSNNLGVYKWKRC